MPIFYASFLTTLTLTPLMRALAHRHGVVDAPDGSRKLHVQPIAYLGGISIFIGWLVGITLAVFLQPHRAGSLATIQIPTGIPLGAATIVLFGLLDDTRGLPPRLKILGQILAAVFLIGPAAIGLFGPADPAGLGGDLFLGPHRGPAWMILDPLSRMGYLPSSLDHSRWILVAATTFSTGIALAIILVACNAANLLDGLDGLCSGVTAIMSLGYLFLALYLAHALANQEIQSPVGSASEPARIALALALLGSVLGFLPFNFNPATIFMGDTGSMFLGYSCGTIILLFGQYGTVRWFLAAIVMFGLPLMDTLLAIVRRKLNRRLLFAPDTRHFHHFLVRRGLSVRQAVFVSYGITFLFVSFGLLIVVVPTSLAAGIYLVLFGWIAVAAFKMGMVVRQVASTAENTTLHLAQDDPPARPLPQELQEDALSRR
jgi:UDP-GlcNAc:undecaprenyl-phosphate GlcNAc-1-phosphate transferase